MSIASSTGTPSLEKALRISSSDRPGATSAVELVAVVSNSPPQRTHPNSEALGGRHVVALDPVVSNSPPQHTHIPILRHCEIDPDGPATLEQRCAGVTSPCTILVFARKGVLKCWRGSL